MPHRCQMQNISANLYKLDDAAALNVAKQNLGLTAKDSKAATSIDKLAAVLQKNPQLLVGSPLAGDLKYQPVAAEISPREKSLAAEAQADGEALKKFTDLLLNGPSGKPPAGPPGGNAPPEATQAFIAYQKQLADGERAYNQQRLDAQKQFQLDSVKSETDYQNSIAKTKLDAARSAREADTKALIDFNHNEAAIKKKADFDRLQQSKAFNQSQLELAAQGDVAGYIAAQKNRNFELGQQDRQTSYDAGERAKQFQWDAQQRHAEAAQQLKDSLADMATQHALERRQAKTAYDQQQSQAELAYQRQQDEQKRNFALQLANLQDNLDGLNALQNEYYSKSTAALDSYLKTNFNTLQKLVSGAFGLGSRPVYGPPAPSAPSSGPPAGGGLFNPTAPLFGAFGAGGGGGGQGGTTIIHVGGVSVGAGNHVTPDQVHKIVGNAVGKIANAIREAN